MHDAYYQNKGQLKLLTSPREALTCSAGSGLLTWLWVEEAEWGRQQQMRNPGATQRNRSLFFPKIWIHAGPLWFETTDTCSSNHSGTTGERQLCPATSGMLEAPALGGKNNLPLSRSPPQPLQIHQVCILSSKTSVCGTAVLDIDGTSSRQTYAMNYSGT